MISNKYYEAKDTLTLAFKKLGIYDFLENPEITEIQCNCDLGIFIDVAGKGTIDSGLKSDPAIILGIINILASLGDLEVNSSNPTISSQLPIWDYRVQCEIPPIVDHPIMTIRKQAIKLFTLDDYIKQGFITEREKKLFKYYIKKKKNILVIGGTNTGKTTFTNALVQEMKDERLVFIEESRELQSQAKNKVFLKVIAGVYSPKQALRSAMRLSPERIIFGEVRGAEAFDLLNAFNSGHSGGVCTIHANDCYSGLEKLETYILYEQDNALSKVIARTIEVVVTLKFVKGKRVLDSIAEVKGFSNDNYDLDFKYKRAYTEEELNELKEIEDLDLDVKGDDKDA